eukprot:4105880-Alexandrium_andersonii.AAC.1
MFVLQHGGASMFAPVFMLLSLMRAHPPCEHRQVKCHNDCCDHRAIVHQACCELIDSGGRRCPNGAWQVARISPLLCWLRAPGAVQCCLLAA